MATQEPPGQWQRLAEAVAVSCPTRTLAFAALSSLAPSEAAAQPTPEVEYEQRLDERDPGHLLTLGQELSFVGAGTLWYWLDRDRNLADWDFPSWEERFTLEAWRLDTNEFPINWLGHPMSGSAFYAMPRANDHGLLASTSYAFATSFAWEFLVEFREKVSINDMIVTLGAGMPIGEFASKFWRYLNGLPERPTLVQSVLAPTLGFPVWVKRTAYGERPAPKGPYDEHGYSTSVSPAVHAGYQLRHHDWDEARATTHGVRLGGRISTIPSEGRPGSYGLFFYDADVASLAVFAGGGDGAREVDLAAEMILLGLYGQSLNATRDGPAGLLGIALAYQYRFRDFDGYNDRLGILRMPGPAADFTYRAGSAVLTTGWRLSGDFAGMHSAAYSGWADVHVRPGDRAKSILRKHGYHYLWGLSSRFSAGLEVAPVDLSGGVTLGTYDSIEDLDRAQEELTLDPHGSERLFELDTSLGLTIPTTPLRVGVGWSTNRRTSRLEEHTALRTMHTLSGSFGVVL